MRAVRLIKLFLVQFASFFSSSAIIMSARKGKFKTICGLKFTIHRHDIANSHHSHEKFELL
jgi:hypothetical protein